MQVIIFVLFLNGAYLQGPEKLSRHPNHRGVVEIFFVSDFCEMRVSKCFGAFSLQACSHRAVFRDHLNGVCSPTLMT